MIATTLGGLRHPYIAHCSPLEMGLFGLICLETILVCNSIKHILIDLLSPYNFSYT